MAEAAAVADAGTEAPTAERSTKPVVVPPTVVTPATGIVKGALGRAIGARVLIPFPQLTAAVEFGWIGRRAMDIGIPC